MRMILTLNQVLNKKKVILLSSSLPVNQRKMLENSNMEAVRMIVLEDHYRFQYLSVRHVKGKERYMI
jgi:hypothetical protein